VLAGFNQSVLVDYVRGEERGEETAILALKSLSI
jgi:hypothetical protein